MKRMLIFFLGLLTMSTAMADERAHDLRQAKRDLLNQVYTPEHRRTFYCECAFGADKSIDAAACGYRPRRNAQRGGRVEWEHVVPVSVYGKYLPCWRQARQVCGRGGGRKCCERTNPDFRSLEGDMHNLVPSVGELNADRENFKFGEIPGEARRYGACDFEVQNRLAEPREEIRGDIARTYLYMNDRTQKMVGHGFMTQSQIAMYVAWSRQDPPDAWECERHRRIQRIQGRANPYVQQGCR